MSKFSRRQFVALMGAAAAGTAVAPMGLLNARRAMASSSCSTASFSSPGFGPLFPQLPNNAKSLTSIAGVGDISDVPLLSLPNKFQYTAISIRGQQMSDGNLVPGDHDGMAVFRGRRGEYILVRNHELSPDENEAGNLQGCLAANGQQYDSFAGAASGLGGGGTTTIVVDRRGNVVKDYVSLGGTIRNCAGGPTYWGSWISCEENVSTPSNDSQATVKHGYNFEVPSELGEAVEPIPLIAMGRMNHEAVSVDVRSGNVYQTEDRGDSAYYKFVPNVRRPNGFGDLQKGGDLYAMRIKPGQRSNCTGELLTEGGVVTDDGQIVRSFDGVDTRGLARGANGSMLPFLGQPLAIEWVKIEDVDPDEDTLRFEAQDKGATVWWRGEGAWFQGGKHYWVCSGAGDAGEGQVWCYDPETETVTLVVESTDENLLDGPDNITVARDGTLYLCEDGSSGSFGEPNFSQRVVGVDANGGLFNFCQNLLTTAEFAGACFSLNGRYMFVNVQGPGITYCIWRTDGRPILL